MNRLQMVILAIICIVLFIPNDCFSAYERVEINSIDDLPEKVSVKGYSQSVDKAVKKFSDTIVDVSVKDYLAGVVYGEIGIAEAKDESGGITDETKRIELYKAQAIIAVNKLKKEIVNGTINGTDSVQVYRLKDVDGGVTKQIYSPAISKAIDELNITVSGGKSIGVSVVTYPKKKNDGQLSINDVFEAYYYSKNIGVRPT